MLDQVKIYVRSGDGGDGAIAFRREKYAPHGGPAGGDGGRGGDVILRAVRGLNTLAPFSRKIHFKAEHGERGGQSNRTGASAEGLIVDVPPGTVVRDAANGEVVADLVRPGDSVVAARGGRGGKGNARYATSSNQAPRVAEKGEPGAEAWLILELRLIADVGIVGVPNAGKSTLLSVISNARPKIADYPFTTLEPNLGVVLMDDRDLVVADIPGLVEGAHLGVGLGHAFLRHVQRTRLLIHLINGASQDPLADYNQINQELALYDERLRERPQIVAFNKIDLPEAQERLEAFQKALAAENVEVLPISGATRQGLQTLIQRVFAIYDALPDQTPIIETMPVYDLPEEQLAFTIETMEEGVFRVVGKRIERAAAMTYWDYEEAILRFQRMLDTLGVTDALRRAGVKEGDSVFIGEHELEWSD
ncbi:MAG: GTPase ObgE [Anaerolineae bacterium]|nr:GTPase ObgE [Anaerolineae bacterium]NUQ05049.1 GTPase ObgE [Anaerolineae bacterium]